MNGMSEGRIHRSQVPDITMHSVQNQDLDLIKKEANLAAVGASGVSLCASTFTALVLTLGTCDVDESWRTFLEALVPLCGVGTLFFAVLWWRGQRQGSRRVNEIKSRPIAEPVGPGADERLVELLRRTLRGGDQ